ncbi:MAG: peptidoglycan DD-metalloendopeptidase family protein [Deltaproteobacteria bacterium]|nr:peptidoglycan DD-metalloendopeptidase family protein [Deltaproteobacteria bacterium]
MMKKVRLPLINRLDLFSLIFALAILPETAYAHAKGISEANQEQIREIESKLSSEREKLKKAGSQEKNLLAELARLDHEVAEKRGAVDELSKQMVRAETEVAQLRNRLVKLKRSSKDVEREISRKLVELYKHAKIGYLTALADVTDMTQFWRRVKYLRAVMKEDRTVLIRGAEQAHELQGEISRTEASLTKIKETSRKQKARLTSLKMELQEKVLRLIKIHKEREFYETAVHELQTAAEGLKQTIINIEKKDSYETNRSCHFRDFKGKLPYPINGRIIGKQKLPKIARSGTYKGIILEAAPNTDVKAVFPGRVAFSGKLKGYGDLVIINHGSRFFTVSAHLSARNKVEGDEVRGGEVLGQVEGKGASRVGRLYFEIRRAGKNLDPREWLNPDNLDVPQ